jgi:hypothetical protein
MECDEIRVVLSKVQIYEGFKIREFRVSHKKQAFYFSYKFEQLRRIFATEILLLTSIL